MLLINRKQYSRVKVITVNQDIFYMRQGKPSNE